MTAGTSVAAIAAKALASSLVIRGGEVPQMNLETVRPEPPKSQRGDDSNQWSEKWFSTPEPFRFAVSGNLGTACFYMLERLVHNYLSNIPSPPPFVEAHKDSISFFVGYMLQIVAQHFLNALLVYGLHTIDTRQKYFTTLTGQYGAYFTAMIGSTVLNTWLRKQGMPKDRAFVFTLVLFACINYFVIGWIVRQAADATSKGDSHIETEDDNKPTTNKMESIPHDDKLNSSDELQSIPRGGWSRTNNAFVESMTSDSLRSFILTVRGAVQNPAIHSQSASLRMKSN